MAESPGLAVRQFACDVLKTIISKRLTVDEAVRGHSGLGRLEHRDQALVSSIVLTAFRHRGEIGKILEKLVDRPLPRKSGPTHDILTLGISQLLFLGMPAHAVIDLAVRSAKADGHARHFAGLVNAVLRRVAVEGPALLQDLDAPRLNTPDWLWARWQRTYGLANAGDIASAHSQKPGLDISFTESVAPWADRLGGTILANGQLRLAAEYSAIPSIPGFQEGAWWVQDAAATIPARLFGELRGKSVLDLCAAPGGKTLQMASMGAHVTAVDISADRLRLLHDNLARTRLTAEVQVADVLSGRLSGQWDAVLLDAPCSATGTIRRHPELPWIRQESQVTRLADTQHRLLQAATRLVKPDGLLVYCTCSLEPEEGEEQVQTFLEENPNFELTPATEPVLPDGALRPEGWVRTLPSMAYGQEAGMDAFFAALMRRRA
ncbi:RsmB/NOP family class I SAM-dependent RNA methyltransferase [Aestuariivirga sp.]|jgi:16S rRNA (cytosine967-C5)-methyltransferase|uniref:RsmB/NOP family class I SAM-dependent RNA methyltransferase n=1 Tax=Aestuariivirga sp. TaxID=2650926 RepID=UPI003784DA29